MAQSARYKSEVFIPIKKDDKTFEERQRSIWDDMHERMEKRRKEWETEVDSMRRDFFRLKPSSSDRPKGSSENLLENMDLDQIFYDDSKSGDKKFRVSFDVKEFQPEEISVRTQDSKLLVYAKHEEAGTGRNISKEFSRQVDIPKHVHPDRLQCTLSNDGILQVEAPVSAPQYDQIKNMSSPNVLNAAPPVSSPRPLSGGPTVTEEDGTKKLKMVIDVGKDFGPQDVSVKTVDRKLIVQAKHEEKSAGRTSFREFNREFDLPEHVDPNLVTACMTNEGKLLVEAPLASYTQGSYTGKPGSTKQPTITIGFGGP